MSSETPEAVKQWLGMCERIVSLWERQQQESRDGQAKYRREAFVMAAMQGLLASHIEKVVCRDQSNPEPEQRTFADSVGRAAIRIADATLRALEQSDSTTQSAEGRIMAM